MHRVAPHERAQQKEQAVTQGADRREKTEESRELQGRRGKPGDPLKGQIPQAPEIKQDLERLIGMLREAGRRD